MFWNRAFGHNMIITYNGQDLFIAYGFMYLCTKVFFNSLEQCMFWSRKFGHNMIITYNGQIKIKKMCLCTWVHFFLLMVVFFLKSMKYKKSLFFR